MFAPLVLAMAAPGEAQVTTPPVEPLVYGAECRASDPTGSRRLEPVINAGKGRVVQRASVFDRDQTDHGFLFLDCRAGQGIVVHEKDNTLRGTVNDPYRIDHTATLDGISAIAVRHGDPVEHIAVGEDQSDAIVDAFCGCRNFYPQSKAAIMTTRP